jgi:hypothetical protein
VKTLLLRITLLENGLKGGFMTVLGSIRDGATGLAAGVTARTQTPAGNALQVQIGPGDVISNLPVVIEYDHHQVHEGETWRWSTYVTSLNSGNNKDVRIVVPVISAPIVAGAPHFRFEVICDALSDVYLYEGTTFTGNGTQRTPINLERNGSYTVKMEIWEDPTVNVIGTQLFRGVTFAAKNNSGGIDQPGFEFVLKSNTSYNFRVTSGTNALKVLIRFLWYEDLGV